MVVKSWFYRCENMQAAEVAMMDKAKGEPEVKVIMNKMLVPWALMNMPMKMRLVNMMALRVVTMVVEMGAVSEEVLMEQVAADSLGH
jgi:hypothetical protein